MGPTKWQEVIDHFQCVNNWPDWKVERYIELMFQIWEIRSGMEWKLNIALLDLLGVAVIE